MFCVSGAYLLPLHHTPYSIYELYRYRVLLHLVFKKLFDQTRKLYVIENIEKGRLVFFYSEFTDVTLHAQDIVLTPVSLEIH